MRKLVAVVALVLVSSVSVAQQKAPPSQDDLPAAPIKDADLFQVTAHQDGAATDYIYNYLESRDGAVWSVQPLASLRTLNVKICGAVPGKVLGGISRGSRNRWHQRKSQSRHTSGRWTGLVSLFTNIGWVTSKWSATS
jgi:hypothetical protein